MNWRLKARIVDKYRTQTDFSNVVKMSESMVSKIVTERRRLDKSAQAIWAKSLDCKPDDIFKEVRT